MKYFHLTMDLRSQIYALKSIGMQQKEIAEQLSVSPTTICRELKRNTGQKGYRPKQAQEKATLRRQIASRRPKTMTAPLLNFIEEKLAEQWSPDQIAGVATSNGAPISHESIYRYIWLDKKAGGLLYQHLRRRGKKYTYRGAATAGRGCIPDRVDIKC